MTAPHGSSPDTEQSMDIYAKPGTRVQFTGRGGYDHHKEHAAKFLTVGSFYTLSGTTVSAWHTDVYLEEFPKEGFNSVMFVEVATPDAAATPKNHEELLKHWQRASDKLQNDLRTSAGFDTRASELVGKTLANVRQKTEAALTGDVAQPSSKPDAWCQPMDCGKHTPRKFLLYFDDPDRGIAVFDNEPEAREAFTKASTAWNCYLFGALPLSSTDGNTR